MKKLAFLVTILALGTENTWADPYYDEYTFEETTNTVYTEVPVRSYYAYPDDPNFIPE